MAGPLRANLAASRAFGVALAAIEAVKGRAVLGTGLMPLTFKNKRRGRRNAKEAI